VAGWGLVKLDRRLGSLTGSHPGSGQMLNTDSGRASRRSVASGQNGTVPQTGGPKD
jgi:hypothetical protein